MRNHVLSSRRHHRSSRKVCMNKHETMLIHFHSEHMYDCYYGRPIEYGRPLYFCPVVSFFYLFFFPRLISVAVDVALVRI